MVHVPDAPERPEPASNKRAGETDGAFRRRMYDEVMGNKPAAPEAPAQVRGADGKFIAKPEGGEGQALQDAADKAAGEKKPEPEVADDTPESREAWIAARRALRRDEYTNEEIDAMDPARVLELGTRRATAQSTLDAEMKRIAGNQPAGAQPSKTTEEQEAESREQADTIARLGIPQDVLDFLPEPEQGKLKTHVGAFLQKQTKAAEGMVNKARAELAEFLGEATVRELAETYPALKAKSPPRDFLDNFYRVRDHYDYFTRDGMKRAMDDAAILTYGRQIKEQVQASMLDRNRASLANQPDPRTLTAPAKGGSVTTREYRRLAFEEVHKGGTLEKQQERLKVRLAGRAIVDAKK